jgi:hypothetical protein
MGAVGASLESKLFVGGRCYGEKTNDLCKTGFTLDLRP